MLLRGSAFRRAVPSAAERLAVALSASHPRSLLHSSARARSSLEELDALCELVRATDVSSVGTDLLERIVECCSNARKEFVQKEMRKTWMIGAATVGGFFVGCLTRTRNIDNKRKGELTKETCENLPNE